MAPISDRFNYYTPLLYPGLNQLFKDIFTESGVGSNQYPVLREYLRGVQEDCEEGVDLMHRKSNKTHFLHICFNNISSEYLSEVSKINDALHNIYVYLNADKTSLSKVL